MNKGNILAWIVLGVSILYVLSPLDFVPGPIDDIILIVVEFLFRKKLFPSEE